MTFPYLYWSNILNETSAVRPVQTAGTSLHLAPAPPALRPQHRDLWVMTPTLCWPQALPGGGHCRRTKPASSQGGCFCVCVQEYKEGGSADWTPPVRNRTNCVDTQMNVRCVSVVHLRLIWPNRYSLILIKQLLTRCRTASPLYTTHTSTQHQHSKPCFTHVTSVTVYRALNAANTQVSYTKYCDWTHPVWHWQSTEAAANLLLACY